MLIACARPCTTSSLTTPPQPARGGLAVSVPNPAPQAAARACRAPVNTLLAWWKWGALVAGVFGLIGCGAMMAIGRRNRHQPRRRRRDRHPVGAGRADADRPVLRHRRRLHVRPAMFTRCRTPSAAAGAGAAGCACSSPWSRSPSRSPPARSSSRQPPAQRDTAGPAGPHRRRRPAPRAPASPVTAGPGLRWTDFHGIELPVSATSWPAPHP